MAQVILIEDNKTLNDLISINLKSFLGVDLIQRENAQDTINLLSILPTIDLIITTSKVGNEPTAEILSHFIRSNIMETGLIVLGAYQKLENDFTVNIENQKDWEQVIHSSAKILGIDESVLSKRIVPDFIAVPVRYFLNLDSINCDVFIRIKKSPTEYQYIKRIHNGDNFSVESIKHYLESGLENFYIAKDAHKIFSIFLSNKLVEKMDSPKTSINKKIQVMGESYEIAIKEIKRLGFNSETIQLTESIIENMLSNFKNFPEMSGLLHKVINSPTGLLFQRCHMTSKVANEILKNLGHSDSKLSESVGYASFFHDIMLADKEEFSNINSLEELENAKLKESDWDLVFNHAWEASELIAKCPESPIGADEIIRHHHGSINGKGFSNSIERLPELSKIFILADQFVLGLFRFKETGKEAHPITEELYKRYPTSDMKVIIKALERTLQKKASPKK